MNKSILWVPVTTVSTYER